MHFSPSSRIRVIVHVDGIKKEYLIIDPLTYKPFDECIAWNSPLAQAITKCHTGETKRMVCNGREIEIHILEVKRPVPK